MRDLRVGDRVWLIRDWVIPRRPHRDRWRSRVKGERSRITMIFRTPRVVECEVLQLPIPRPLWLRNLSLRNHARKVQRMVLLKWVNPVWDFARETDKVNRRYWGFKISENYTAMTGTPNRRLRVWIYLEDVFREKEDAERVLAGMVLNQETDLW